MVRRALLYSRAGRASAAARMGQQLLALVALALIACTPLRAADEAPPAVELAGGFTEIVITTRDPAAWVEMLTEVGGWEVRSRAPLSSPELTLWNLPEGASGETILLANRGADRGFVRLVQLENVEQEMIRADDRPWDTGGFFDANMRLADMAATHAAMQARGWQGESPPVEFTFGPFTVREWIARGPDGARLAVMQRVAPPLEGWPNLVRASRVFNATITVPEMGPARAWFENVLGMRPYLVSSRPSSEAGPNVLGLPHNVTTMISRDVVILHPEGRNDGSIELLAFVGGWGADFSDRAVRHNLGIATARFPVVDLERAITRLRAHDVEMSGEPVTVTLAPYGQVRMVGIRGPAGVWLELYERLDN